MKCRFARPGEEDALAALWRRCFREDARTVAALLPRLLALGRAPVVEEDGELCSMLLALPVTVRDTKGEQQSITYIYAFCTAPERRGLGYGRALLRWTEARAKERGDCAAALIPGTEALFGYYEALGYVRAFPRKTEELVCPAAQGGDCTVERLSPAEYGALREALLSGTAHAAYDEGYLRAQEALCRLSGGGGLYAVTVGVLRCAAAVECWPGEPARVKELLAPAALRSAVAGALSRETGREAVRCSFPSREGTLWGAVKPLGEALPARLWFGLGLE